MQVDNRVLKRRVGEMANVGFFWGNLLDKSIIYVNVFRAYFPKEE